MRVGSGDWRREARRHDDLLQSLGAMDENTLAFFFLPVLLHLKSCFPAIAIAIAKT